jgi:hypothetical protein
VRQASAGEAATYIGNAGYDFAFEIAAIEFFDGSAKIIGRFELDEAAPSTVSVLHLLAGWMTYPRPSFSRPVSEYTTSRLDWRAKSLRSYFQKPCKSLSRRQVIESQRMQADPRSELSEREDCQGAKEPKRSV